MRVKQWVATVALLVFCLLLDVWGIRLVLTLLLAFMIWRMPSPVSNELAAWGVTSEKTRELANRLLSKLVARPDRAHAAPPNGTENKNREQPSESEQTSDRTSEWVQGPHSQASSSSVSHAAERQKNPYHCASCGEIKTRSAGTTKHICDPAVEGAYQRKLRAQQEEQEARRIKALPSPMELKESTSQRVPRASTPPPPPAPDTVAIQPSCST